MIKSDWRATNPPPTPIISQDPSNQNLEIAIFFNMIERVGNYVLKDDKLPPNSPQGKGYKLFHGGI